MYSQKDFVFPNFTFLLQ